MGRRVHIRLVDVIANQAVTAQLYWQNIVQSEGIEDGDKQQLAAVRLHSTDDNGRHKGKGEMLVFDVSVHEGEVTLETDFNRWSPAFEFKLRFIDSLSCPYTVV